MSKSVRSAKNLLRTDLPLNRSIISNIPYSNNSSRKLPIYTCHSRRFETSHRSDEIIYNHDVEAALAYLDSKRNQNMNIALKSINNNSYEVKKRYLDHEDDPLKPLENQDPSFHNHNLPYPESGKYDDLSHRLLLSAAEKLDPSFTSPYNNKTKNVVSEIPSFGVNPEVLVGTQSIMRSSRKDFAQLFDINTNPLDDYVTELPLKFESMDPTCYYKGQFLIDKQHPLHLSYLTFHNEVPYSLRNYHYYDSKANVPHARTMYRGLPQELAHRLHTLDSMYEVRVLNIAKFENVPIAQSFLHLRNSLTHDSTDTYLSSSAHGYLTNIHNVQKTDFSRESLELANDLLKDSSSSRSCVSSNRRTISKPLNSVFDFKDLEKNAQHVNSVSLGPIFEGLDSEMQSLITNSQIIDGSIGTNWLFHVIDAMRCSTPSTETDLLTHPGPLSQAAMLPSTNAVVDPVGLDSSLRQTTWTLLTNVIEKDHVNTGDLGYTYDAATNIEIMVDLLKTLQTVSYASLPFSEETSLVNLHHLCDSSPSIFSHNSIYSHFEQAVDHLQIHDPLSPFSYLNHSTAAIASALKTSEVPELNVDHVNKSFPPVPTMANPSPFSHDWVVSRTWVILWSMFMGPASQHSAKVVEEAIKVFSNRGDVFSGLKAIALFRYIRTTIHLPVTSGLKPPSETVGQGRGGKGSPYISPDYCDYHLYIPVLEAAGRFSRTPKLVHSIVEHAQFAMPVNETSYLSLNEASSLNDSVTTERIETELTPAEIMTQTNLSETMYSQFGERIEISPVKTTLRFDSNQIPVVKDIFSQTGAAFLKIYNQVDKKSSAKLWALRHAITSKADEIHKIASKMPSRLSVSTVELEEDDVTSSDKEFDELPVENKEVDAVDELFGENPSNEVDAMDELFGENPTKEVDAMDELFGNNEVEVDAMDELFGSDTTSVPVKTETKTKTKTKTKPAKRTPSKSTRRKFPHNSKKERLHLLTNSIKGDYSPSGRVFANSRGPSQHLYSKAFLALKTMTHTVSVDKSRPDIYSSYFSSLVEDSTENIRTLKRQNRSNRSSTQVDLRDAVQANNDYDKARGEKGHIKHMSNNPTHNSEYEHQLQQTFMDLPLCTSPLQFDDYIKHMHSESHNFNRPSRVVPTATSHGLISPSVYNAIADIYPIKRINPPLLSPNINVHNVCSALLDSIDQNYRVSGNMKQSMEIFRHVNHPRLINKTTIQTSIRKSNFFSSLFSAIGHQHSTDSEVSTPSLSSCHSTNPTPNTEALQVLHKSFDVPLSISHNPKSKIIRGTPNCRLDVSSVKVSDTVASILKFYSVSYSEARPYRNFMIHTHSQDSDYDVVHFIRSSMVSWFQNIAQNPSMFIDIPNKSDTTEILTNRRELNLNRRNQMMLTLSMMVAAGNSSFIPHSILNQNKIIDYFKGLYKKNQYVNSTILDVLLSHSAKHLSPSDVNSSIDNYYHAGYRMSKSTFKTLLFHVGKSQNEKLINELIHQWVAYNGPLKGYHSKVVDPVYYVGTGILDIPNSEYGPDPFSSQDGQTSSFYTRFHRYQAAQHAQSRPKDLATAYSLINSKKIRNQLHLIKKSALVLNDSVDLSINDVPLSFDIKDVGVAGIDSSLSLRIPSSIQHSLSFEAIHAIYEMTSGNFSPPVLSPALVSQIRTTPSIIPTDVWISMIDAYIQLPTANSSALDLKSIQLKYILNPELLPSPVAPITRLVYAMAAAEYEHSLKLRKLFNMFRFENPLSDEAPSSDAPGFVVGSNIKSFAAKLNVDEQVVSSNFKTMTSNDASYDYSVLVNGEPTPTSRVNNNQFKGYIPMPPAYSSSQVMALSSRVWAHLFKRLSQAKCDKLMFASSSFYYSSNRHNIQLISLLNPTTTATPFDENTAPLVAIKGATSNASMDGSSSSTSALMFSKRSISTSTSSTSSRPSSPTRVRHNGLSSSILKSTTSVAVGMRRHFSSHEDIVQDKTSVKYSISKDDNVDSLSKPVAPTISNFTDPSHWAELGNSSEYIQTLANCQDEQDILDFLFDKKPNEEMYEIERDKYKLNSKQYATVFYEDSTQLSDRSGHWSSIINTTSDVDMEHVEGNMTQVLAMIRSRIDYPTLISQLNNMQENYENYITKFNYYKNQLNLYNQELSEEEITEYDNYLANYNAYVKFFRRLAKFFPPIKDSILLQNGFFDADKSIYTMDKKLFFPASVGKVRLPVYNPHLSRLPFTPNSPNTETDSYSVSILSKSAIHELMGKRRLLNRTFTRLASSSDIARVSYPLVIPRSVPRIAACIPTPSSSVITGRVFGTTPCADYMKIHNSLNITPVFNDRSCPITSSIPYSHSVIHRHWRSSSREYARSYSRNSTFNHFGPYALSLLQHQYIIFPSSNITPVYNGIQFPFQFDAIFSLIASYSSSGGSIQDPDLTHKLIRKIANVFEKTFVNNEYNQHFSDRMKILWRFIQYTSPEYQLPLKTILEKHNVHPDYINLFVEPYHHRDFYIFSSVPNVQNFLRDILPYAVDGLLRFTKFSNDDTSIDKIIGIAEKSYSVIT